MNQRLARLLKLHGLYCRPAGEDGSDTGGTDTGVELDEPDAEEGETEAEPGESEEEGEEAEAETEDPAGTGEQHISFGEPQTEEEGDPARAPEWLRDLRKSNRDKDKRIRELEQRVAASVPAPAKIVVGERPKVDDYNFDAEDPGYLAAVDQWYTRKNQVEQQANKAREDGERLNAQWTARSDAVAKASGELKVSGQEDAIAAFEALFSPVQRGIIIGGPEDPKTSAMLRFALGNNPKKARELSAIEDPVKFAVAIGKLETQLKTAPRKSAPPPDSSVRSGVAGAGNAEYNLKQLKEKAGNTGDYSAYFAAKRAREAKDSKK